MKIDYKILWLDDNIQEFVDDELIESLEQFLEEAGFRPIINYTASIKDFFSSLNDSYDLIMTDYHMKDMNGDKVVEKIRSSEYSILTEILFYTAQADLKDTNKISRVSFLETNTKTGTHQEALIEETKKLIALTIKKFQNIVAMRGMIMHETSSLDLRMDKIVKFFISNPENKEQIDEILMPIFEKIEKNAKEKYDKAKSKKTNKILGDTVLFSSAQKIFALGEILKKLQIEDFSKRYNDEIIWYRNQFAHAELIKDESGKEYFKVKIEGKEDELIFDEELCKKIRKNINKHKAYFDNLQNALS